MSILNLAGGTESISLQNLNVKGNVQIQNVSGNAVVAMDAASAASLRILNGPGQFDQTDLSSIHVTGTVQINNLADQALASVDSCSTIGGDLQITDGPGQLDQTVIEDTTVGEDLLVAGSGSAGDVIVLLSSQVMGTTDITGGDGGDTVIIGSATFGGDFQLQTGAGADTVSVAPGRIDYKAIQYVPVVRVENGIEVTVFVPEEIEERHLRGRGRLRRHGDHEPGKWQRHIIPGHGRRGHFHAWSDPGRPGGAKYCACANRQSPVPADIRELHD